MRITTFAAVAALSLGIGVAVADSTAIQATNMQLASLPHVSSQTYHRDNGDWAQLTNRQTANVELAYVTTTRGESTQQWNQNEGVGG